MAATSFVEGIAQLYTSLAGMEKAAELVIQDLEIGPPPPLLPSHYTTLKAFLPLCVIQALYVSADDLAPIEDRASAIAAFWDALIYRDFMGELPLPQKECIPTIPDKQGEEILITLLRDDFLWLEEVSANALQYYLYRIWELIWLLSPSIELNALWIKTCQQYRVEYLPTDINRRTFLMRLLNIQP